MAVTVQRTTVRDLTLERVIRMGWGALRNRNAASFPEMRPGLKGRERLLWEEIKSFFSLQILDFFPPLLSPFNLLFQALAIQCR